MKTDAMHPVAIVSRTVVPLPSCMGGWCALRAACCHHQREDRRNPVERLCEPGADGVIDGYPVVVIRPSGSWERGRGALLAPADAMAGIVGALA